LNQGRIIETGEIGKVFASPQTRWVASFLGYENIYPAHRPGPPGSKLYDLGEVTIEAADSFCEDCSVAIRSDEIRLYKVRPTEDEANLLTGTIVAIQNRTKLVTVEVDVGVVMKASMLRSAFEQMCVKTGDPTWIAFQAVISSPYHVSLNKGYEKSWNKFQIYIRTTHYMMISSKDLCKAIYKIQCKGGDKILEVIREEESISKLKVASHHDED